MIRMALENFLLSTFLNFLIQLFIIKKPERKKKVSPAKSPRTNI